MSYRNKLLDTFLTVIACGIAAVWVIYPPATSIVPSKISILVPLLAFKLQSDHLGLVLQKSYKLIFAAIIATGISSCIIYLQCLVEDCYLDGRNRYITIIFSSPIIFLVPFSTQEGIMTPWTKLIDTGMALWYYGFMIIQTDVPLFTASWYLILCAAVPSVIVFFVTICICPLIFRLFPHKFKFRSVMTCSSLLLPSIDSFGRSLALWYEGTMEFLIAGGGNSEELDVRRRDCEKAAGRIKTIIRDLKSELWAELPTETLQDLEDTMELFFSQLAGIQLTYDSGYSGEAWDSVWAPLWTRLSVLKLGTVALLRNSSRDPTEANKKWMAIIKMEKGNGLIPELKKIRELQASTDVIYDQFVEVSICEEERVYKAAAEEGKFCDGAIERHSMPNRDTSRISFALISIIRFSQIVCDFRAIVLQEIVPKMESKFLWFSIPHFAFSFKLFFRNVCAIFVDLFKREKYLIDVNAVNSKDSFFISANVTKKFLLYPFRMALGLTVISLVLTIWGDSNPDIKKFEFWAYFPCVFCFLNTTGAAIVAGFLRVLGTLVGSAFAVVSILTMSGNSIAYFLLNLMLVFVAKLGALTNGYDRSWFVFIFTWQVVAFSAWDSGDDETVGLYRILATVSGVLAAVLMTCLLFPSFAYASLKGMTAQSILLNVEIVNDSMRKILENPSQADQNHNSLIRLTEDIRVSRKAIFSSASAEIRVLGSVKKNGMLLNIQRMVDDLNRKALVSHSAAKLAIMDPHVYSEVLNWDAELVTTIVDLLSRLKSGSKHMALIFLQADAA